MQKNQRLNTCDLFQNICRPLLQDDSNLYWHFVQQPISFLGNWMIPPCNFSFPILWQNTLSSSLFWGELLVVHKVTPQLFSLCRAFTVPRENRPLKGQYFRRLFFIVSEMAVMLVITIIKGLPYSRVFAQSFTWISNFTLLYWYNSHYTYLTTESGELIFPTSAS